MPNGVCVSLASLQFTLMAVPLNCMHFHVTAIDSNEEVYRQRSMSAFFFALSLSLCRFILPVFRFCAFWKLIDFNENACENVIIVKWPHAVIVCVCVFVWVCGCFSPLISNPMNTKNRFGKSSLALGCRKFDTKSLHTRKPHTELILLLYLSI